MGRQKNIRGQRDGFVSLIGLIFVLVIVYFLVLKMMDIYVKKPVMEKGTWEATPGRVDTGQGEYDTVLNRIRNQVDEINKKTSQREKELEAAIY